MYRRQQEWLHFNLRELRIDETMDTISTMCYLVVSRQRGEIFDNRGQADPQRVELAGHDGVELERPQEGEVLLVVHQLVVSECKDVESSLEIGRWPMIAIRATWVEQKIKKSPR